MFTHKNVSVFNSERFCCHLVRLDSRDNFHSPTALPFKLRILLDLTPPD